MPKRNPESAHIETLPESGQEVIVQYRKGFGGQAHLQYICDLGPGFLAKSPWRSDLQFVPWCRVETFENPPSGVVATRWGR